MKVLITGGLGFIGRAITRQLLARGDVEIVIVDKLSEQVHGPNPEYPAITRHEKVVFHHNDILDTGVMSDALEGVDAVIHLAAETGTGQSMYEICRYYETNIMGTANMLQEMVKNESLRPKRLILSSSRSIYGEGAYCFESELGNAGARRHYPIARSNADMDNGSFEFELDGKPLVPIATREADLCDPQSLYASSKLGQEQMCQISCKSIGVKFTALRLQNVYGPGQSLRNPYTGILSIFTNLLRQGKDIDIFEDGEESRDFVFVEDVATCFCNSLDLPEEAPQIMNVGMGKSYTVSELVAMLERKMETGKRSRISGRYRPGDIRHNFADTSLMEKHLFPEQLIDLEEGLSRTVDWALELPVEEDRSAAARAEMIGFLGRG